ncbi:MAG: low affinity iron permease family protein [Lacunisphaera sp.]|nr:low affinity iron permease family protein [Lacunisphaera sp.]MDB6166500.1 low affinity iron permease family protein [Lacunisphaera sp.]
MPLPAADKIPQKHATFGGLARLTSSYAGKPATFAVAVALIVVWAVTGPLFHFSDTWQLVINTTTTIITFLMVFLIQNSQNRDSEALHIKLDELIHKIDAADNSLLDLEELEGEELDQIRGRYLRAARQARGKPTQAIPPAAAKSSPGPG